MLTQSQVAAPSNVSAPDGAIVNTLVGKLGDLIVSELHGKYFTQAYRGNLFYASNAAGGAAYTIFSNTSYVGLGLWNPPGSGKLLSLCRVNIGLNAIASTAIACFGFSWVNNVASLVGTAAPISAATAITATRGPCMCGPSGGSSAGSVATVVSAFTVTAAMTWGRALSLSALTGITTVQVGIVLGEDIDGTLVVPPGTMLALTTNVLSGYTAVGTIIWEEIPL